MKKETILNSFKFLSLIAILTGCWWLGRELDIDFEHYREMFKQYPVFISGLIFIGLYSAITLVVWFVAKDVFRIMAAVLYGPLTSTIIIWLAELLNAFILFHLSRLLGREFVQQRFKVRSKDIDHVKKDTSFWWILALKINPLFPFRLLDLGFGLSSASFLKYFTISAIFTPFRIYWLQFVLAGVGGEILKDINFVRDFLVDNPFIIIYSVIYFLSVFVLTIIAFTVQSQKRKDASYAGRV